MIQLNIEIDINNLFDLPTCYLNNTLMKRHLDFFLEIIDK